MLIPKFKESTTVADWGSISCVKHAAELSKLLAELIVFS